jgi:hypothetical protein
MQQAIHFDNGHPVSGIRKRRRLCNKRPAGVVGGLFRHQEHAVKKK